MDPVTALQKCGGAARTPQLRALGVRDSALRTASGRGLVRRVGRGAYALPGAPPELVRAVELCAVVSHASAAALHGLSLWRPPTILELTVPRNTHRSVAGVRIHRADLTDRDRDPLRAVTSIERTLLDCGRTMPLLDAVVLLDGAERERLISHPVLMAAAARASGPGSAALRRAVAHVCALAGSALESVLRLLLELLGCDVRAQVKIRGVGHVDFEVNDWLVIEGDGYEFHRNRANYREDRRRANRLALQGKVLLRFTWEDVRLHPMRVLAQVEAMLRLGPPR